MTLQALSCLRIRHRGMNRQLRRLLPGWIALWLCISLPWHTIAAGTEMPQQAGQALALPQRTAEAPTASMRIRPDPAPASMAILPWTLALLLGGSCCWLQLRLRQLRRTHCRSAEQTHEQILALTTARRRAEQIARHLSESESRLRHMFELPLVGRAILRPDGRWLEVNSSLCAMFGYNREEMLKLAWSDLIWPEDYAIDHGQLDQLLRGEIESYSVEKRLLRQDRKLIWGHLTVGCIRYPQTGVDSIVILFKDITVHKQAAQHLRQMATVDPLTGLANRRHFDLQLEQEWSRARRTGTPLGILFIDVDFFKKFNDKYGHPQGDQCLVEIARIFAGSVARPGDLVARYGGEEFIALLPDTDLHGALNVGERLRAAVEDQAMPHVRSNLLCKIVTVSIGCASMIPNGDHPAAELVEYADLALYRAKRSGRNRVSSALIEPPRERSASCI